MTTTLSLSLIRVEDLRPVDFAPGKRLAISRDEMAECECCGRRIAKVFVLSNGLRVGSECEGYLTTPIYRLGRTNKKADAILAMTGGLR